MCIIIFVCLLPFHPVSTNSSSLTLNYDKSIFFTELLFKNFNMGSSQHYHDSKLYWMHFLSLWRKWPFSSSKIADKILKEEEIWEGVGAAVFTRPLVTLFLTPLSSLRLTLVRAPFCSDRMTNEYYTFAEWIFVSMVYCTNYFLLILSKYYT